MKKKKKTNLRSVKKEALTDRLKPRWPVVLIKLITWVHMVFSNSPQIVEDLDQPEHGVEHYGATYYQTIPEIQYCVWLWLSLQATGSVVEGVSG